MGPQIVRHTLKAVSWITFGLLMGASPAWAVRDWNLSEELDPLLGAEVCRAWTNVARVENLSVELSTSFPKAAEKFPIVYVKVVGLPEAAPQAMVKISSRVSHPLFLFKEATAEGEADIYWYAPTDQEKLIDVIADANNLEVTFNPQAATPQKASISLRGSSATLSQTLDCTERREFQSREFLKYLNGEVGFLTLPASATPQELFDQVQLSHAQYQQEKDLKTQIENNSKEVTRLKRAEAQAQSIFKSSDDKLAELEKEQTDKKIKLTETQTQVPILQQQVLAAATKKDQKQTVFNQKKAAFDPVKAQVSHYEEEVSEYQRQVEGINGLISSAKSEISGLESDISAWSRESSNLERRISQLQSSLDPLRREKRQLENELAGFNVDAVADDILDQDFNYRRARQDLRTYQADLENAVQVAEQVRRQFRQAKRQFNECRGLPVDADVDGFGISIGGDAGPVIEMIGSILLEGLEIDFAAADGACADQRRVVQEKRQQLQAAQNQLAQLQDLVGRYTQQIAQIEDRALQQAEQQRRELVSDLNEVVDRMDDTQSELDRAQNRVRDISNLASNARNEIRSLTSSVLDYERQLTAAKRSLATAKSDLETKKTQVGYNRLYNEYEAARQELSQAQRDAKKAEDAYSNALAAVDAYKTRLGKLVDLIAAQTLDRDQKMAVLNTATQSRVQAEDLQVQLQSSLTTVQAALAESRKLYQELYEKLMEAPAVAPVASI